MAKLLSEPSPDSEELRLLTDALPALISYVDAGQRYRFVNRAYSEWFGHSREEIQGRHMREVLGEAAYAKLRPSIESALAGRKVSFEGTVPYPNGEMRHIHADYIPRTAPGGSVEGFYVLVSDASERKRAETALRESEERFRMVADSAPVLIWMSGTDKGMVWANKAWLDHTGRPIEAELGEGWLENVHPDDLPALAACAEAFEARRPFRTEFRLRRHDGAWRWMEDRGVPRFDSDGAFLGFIGSCLDITDRREAEAKLQESEQRFRLIADSAPVPMWVTQLDRKRGFVNRAYVDFLGVSYEEAVHFDWRTIIHPDDRDRILAESVAGEATMKAFVLEGRYRRADGEWRWLRSTSQPRFGPSGEHIGFIGVAHDITEAKRAEAALKESEERYRTIFEQAHDYIITADLNFVATAVNPAVTAALGYSGDELVGRSFKEFLDPDEYEQAKIMLQKKLREGGTTRYTITVRARDGRRLIWEINSQLITDSSGRPVALNAIGRDVTEQRRAEQHLRLMVDELNHRVKNTLAIVQGIAHQSFRNEAIPPETRLAFEGRLEALSVAHNLLTRENWESADLRDVVAGALGVHDDTSGRFTIGGPELRLEPKTAVTIAMALHELATNATKYGALSTDKGKVAVEWRVSDGPEPRLHICWEEKDGPAVQPPARRGFGSRMIERALAGGALELARLDFRCEGLVCEIDAPLPSASTGDRGRPG